MSGRRTPSPPPISSHRARCAGVARASRHDQSRGRLIRRPSRKSALIQRSVTSTETIRGESYSGCHRGSVGSRAFPCSPAANLLRRTHATDSRAPVTSPRPLGRSVRRGLDRPERLDDQRRRSLESPGQCLEQCGTGELHPGRPGLDLSVGRAVQRAGLEHAGPVQRAGRDVPLYRRRPAQRRIDQRKSGQLHRWDLLLYRQRLRPPGEPHPGKRQLQFPGAGRTSR